VVDLQNYDAHPDYALAPILRDLDPAAATHFYARVAGVVVPNVQRLLDVFRARGERVIYCQSGALLADGADLFPRRRVRFLGTADGRRTIFHRGEVEYEILDAVRPDPSDIVLHKSTVSAFNSSSLDRVLRGLDVTSLVVTGVVTDGCVDSTARDASDLGYDCTIAEDGCAAWAPAWHDAALQAFERYFGLVLATEDIVTGLAVGVAGTGPHRVPEAADRPRASARAPSL
jgi:nicotinamidase-related amidase